jgi:hypothetical protein
MDDDAETLSEYLERFFDEAAVWLPWATSALLGLIIVHLLRERPRERAGGGGPSAAQLGRVTGLPPTSYTSDPGGQPRGGQPRGGHPLAEPIIDFQIDPRKFLHTPEDCPLTGCSRCTRPK